MVKDCLNKVSRSYQDFNRQFDCEEDNLNDPTYLRISSNIRDVELRVSKWILDFNTRIETVSHFSHASKSSKSSTRSRKSNKSRISQAPSSTLDDMIRNRAKIAELKVKSEFFEKEKGEAQAELYKTMFEKEVSAAQAADKVHRKFLDDSYALTSSKDVEESGVNNEKITMKSEVDLDFSKEENKFVYEETIPLNARGPLNLFHITVTLCLLHLILQ